MDFRPPERSVHRDAQPRDPRWVEFDEEHLFETARLLQRAFGRRQQTAHYIFGIDSLRTCAEHWKCDLPDLNTLGLKHCHSHKNIVECLGNIQFRSDQLDTQNSVELLV